MYPSQRQDNIMEILRAERFASVKSLEEKLHYSSSTISRDIAALARQGVVEKTYGGVAIIDRGIIPRPIRRSYEHKLKEKIAARASEYIKDGDTVFLDGSTTTQFIADHITERKNLTVITNNLELACRLSASDTKVIALGGEVMEFPCVVSGDIAVDNADRIKIDKMFFSTYSFNRSGDILAKVNTFYQMLKVLFENSREIFYLADSKKLDLYANYVITTFDKIDYLISDCDFDNNVISKFPSTVFNKI